ncbi:hypothetical protein Tco_1568588 [Tanacetum coccineum]
MNNSKLRSDEQKNLYRALVYAYESDELILDTYGDTVLFKRHRDDEDKDEEPSAGSNWGSKKRRAGKEPESTSATKEKASKTSGKPTKLPSPDHDWNKTLPDAHGPVQPWLSSLAQKEYPRESFNELMDTPLDFSTFVMNRLKVDTLTPELLTGPIFELMKGSCKSLQYPHDLRKPLPLIPNSRGRHVIPFDHFINNDLEYLSGGVLSRKYATLVTKTKAADYGHIKWIKDLVPNRMWSQVLESARDVYSKRRIIVVTMFEIVDWHNYKHLDWITIRRDDDKLYKFKEGDFNRLRIQDIEDMVLFLIQGKLTNLTVEERLAFNILKEGKLTQHTPIPELLQTIWRQSDKDKAGAIIQAIDKQLNTRRIMWSLEKFIGGRPYEGDSADVIIITDKMDSIHSTLSMYYDYGAHVKEEILVMMKNFQKHAEFDEFNANVLERFYTLDGNPIKEILLKLNLPDQKLILTD